MGNCWPKLKFKTTRNYESQVYKNRFKTNSSNSTNNSSNKKKKDKINQNYRTNENKIKKHSSNEQHNHMNMAASLNLHELSINNKKQILQPRRDLEANLDMNSNNLNQSNSTAAATATTTTPATNFKQFCKNSADKLTHKLSFNHKTASTNKSQNASDNDTINENKIIYLFDKYKDNKEINCILANGVQQLCDDLSLKPDDFKILLLAWKLNAKQMCKFTKDEFLNGFKYNLKIDNLKDLKQKLAIIEEDIKINQNEFRNLYRWTFDFGLDSDTGERAIPIEMAILLWELVYVNQEPPILTKWIKFLNEHTNVKGVSRDTWNMFPLFAKSIGEFNYHLYDDNEAWPCLFDDFVQSELSKLNEAKLDINNNNSNCDNI